MLFIIGSLISLFGVQAIPYNVPQWYSIVHFVVHMTQLPTQIWNDSFILFACITTEMCSISPPLFIKRCSHAFLSQIKVSALTRKRRADGPAAPGARQSVQPTLIEWFIVLSHPIFPLKDSVPQTLLEKWAASRAITVRSLISHSAIEMKQSDPAASRSVGRHRTYCWVLQPCVLAQSCIKKIKKDHGPLPVKRHWKGEKGGGKKSGDKLINRVSEFGGVKTGVSLFWEPRADSAFSVFLLRSGPGKSSWTSSASIPK